ncbi:MAG: hypothetical protein ACLPX9_07305 [Rhodomicrobium sp.]
MNKLDQNKKRGMMLFAFLVLSATVILNAILLGSTIHKFINAL